MTAKQDILDLCGTLGINVNQYYILLLLFLRRTGWGVLYTKYLPLVSYTKQDLEQLIEKGYLISVKASYSSPNGLIPTDKGTSLFESEDMGEELYQNYPSIFPLTNGGFFMTKGDSKEHVIDLYMTKIKGDAAKHQEVIRQIKRYAIMVESGHLNGHKLLNFVESELWDTISQLPDNLSGNFKDDI